MHGSWNRSYTYFMILICTHWLADCWLLGERERERERQTHKVSERMSDSKNKKRERDTSNSGNGKSLLTLNNIWAAVPVAPTLELFFFLCFYEHLIKRQHILTATGAMHSIFSVNISKYRSAINRSSGSNLEMQCKQKQTTTDERRKKHTAPVQTNEKVLHRIIFG